MADRALIAEMALAMTPDRDLIAGMTPDRPVEEVKDRPVASAEVKVLEEVKISGEIPVTIIGKPGPSGLAGIDKIYVVSVDCFTERIKAVQLIAHYHGLSMEIVALPLATKFTTVEGTQTRINGNERYLAAYNVSAGYLGNMLCHMEIMRRITTEGHKRCLVLEDDFELIERFSELLAWAMSKWNPEVNPILLLSPYISSYDGMEVLHKEGEYSLSTVTKHVWSAAAYVIEGKHARKIHEDESIGFDDNMSSEHSIIQAAANICVCPPLVIEREGPSTVVANREQVSQVYWRRFRTKRFSVQMIRETLTGK